MNLIIKNTMFSTTNTPVIHTHAIAHKAANSPNGSSVIILLSLLQRKQ